MQPSWISVDFDNWRDWENEEDDGKEEYDRYVDVSTCKKSSNIHVISPVCVYQHCRSQTFFPQMIREMADSNKGEAPDMDDLSDVSAQFCSYVRLRFLSSLLKKTTPFIMQ